MTRLMDLLSALGLGLVLALTFALLVFVLVLIRAVSDEVTRRREARGTNRTLD